jgi:hypothetical protein
MIQQEKILRRIEKNYNIDEAIKYIESNHEKDLDDFLRVIFLLQNFLVNGQYTKKEYDFVASKINKIFLETKSKYSHVPEYLFYVGFIASMAEWYFNIKIEDIESMIKDATQFEPENLLYKWRYYAITDQRSEINTKLKYLLSKQILENNVLMQGIESKGSLGKYLEGFIQYTYESTKLLL